MSEHLITEARDQLERNYIQYVTGNSDQRYQQIDEMPDAVARLAAMASMKFAEAYPHVVERVAGLRNHNSHDVGYRFIGAGSEQSVYFSKQPAAEEPVRKLLRSSLHWNEQRQQAEIARRNFEHTLLVSHLGKYMLQQCADVSYYDMHKRQKQGIVTRQEALFNYQKIAVFPSYENNIMSEALNTLSDQNPRIVAELGRFSVRALELYDRHGLLVDTSGQENLVIANRNGRQALVLLDGDPVNVDQASVSKRIVSQLDALDRAVNL